MTDSGTIAVFGAGNIGRSFVGQLFARAGWKVVFIDVDPGLVAELNVRGSYPVVIKRQGLGEERIEVAGVSAVDGRDAVSVSALLARAGLAACCVGKAALPKILPALAAGLLEREHRAGTPPLDLIIAENDREAPATIRRGLEAILPAGFLLKDRLGLVETSIGKMVPLMRAEDLARDRLLVFAEAYNSLILDGKGFLGPMPKVDGLFPVDRIDAYVDRKLFVHNLGHAAIAYLGYLADPSVRLLAKALHLPGVRECARAAMGEAAAALAAEYPEALSPEALAMHIDDLLSRFANEALGDTLHRVGRDLPRKLSRPDRIVGAALLCSKHSLPCQAIAAVFAAAIRFRAPDESGALFPADAEFARLLAEEGLEVVLSRICGLDASHPIDAGVKKEFLHILG